jgi:hypothetical protein
MLLHVLQDALLRTQAKGGLQEVCNHSKRERRGEMNARYIIFELDNGWVLFDCEDGSEVFYVQFADLVASIDAPIKEK